MCWNRSDRANDQLESGKVPFFPTIIQQHLRPLRTNVCAGRAYDGVNQWHKTIVVEPWKINRQRQAFT